MAVIVHTVNFNIVVILPKMHLNPQPSSPVPENVQALSFTMPPFNVPSQIAGHVRTQQAKFDKLIAEAKKGIILLKERRSVLASAAVTSKIDVRSFAAEREAV